MKKNNITETYLDAVGINFSTTGCAYVHVEVGDDGFLDVCHVDRFIHFDVESFDNTSTKFNL